MLHLVSGPFGGTIEPPAHHAPSSAPPNQTEHLRGVLYPAGPPTGLRRLFPSHLSATALRPARHTRAQHRPPSQPPAPSRPPAPPSRRHPRRTSRRTPALVAPALLPPAARGWRWAGARGRCRCGVSCGCSRRPRAPAGPRSAPPTSTRAHRSALTACANAPACDQHARAKHAHPHRHTHTPRARARSPPGRPHRHTGRLTVRHTRVHIPHDPAPPDRPRAPHSTAQHAPRSPAAICARAAHRRSQCDSRPTRCLLYTSDAADDM
eukprot:3162648-Rhodomonas_salina.1